MEVRVECRSSSYPVAFLREVESGDVDGAEGSGKEESGRDADP